MKRGLKGHIQYGLLHVLQVTTVTPMKRGLKGLPDADIGYIGISYNRYPDEKGTERLKQPSVSIVIPLSYNRYPDEKGTESQLSYTCPTPKPRW